MMAKRRSKDSKSSEEMISESAFQAPNPSAAEGGSAPTPQGLEAAAAQEEKREAATAANVTPVEPTKPSVTIQVFRAVSGIKPDVFAGFARFVQREELRPCPVKEWHERYEAFQKRPVKRAR